MNRRNNTTYVAHVRKSDAKVQTVQKHLAGVSDRAGRLADKIGLGTLGVEMGLLHDIGKYSDVFQAYINSAAGQIEPNAEEFVDAKGMKGKIDHSSAGAQYIWEVLQQEGRGEWYQLLAAQMMALCIASHHSGLMDCLAPDGRDVFTGRMQKPEEKTHLAEVQDKVEQSLKDSVNSFCGSREIWEELRARMESFAAEDNPQIQAFNLGLVTRFLFSALIDADRLDTAGFSHVESAKLQEHDAPFDWTILTERFEDYIHAVQARNRIDEIRASVSSRCLDHAMREKGLYQLTVPTGGGKTLASLRFALHHARKHKMDKIIYVIPYTSIIDQNAAVARGVLENTSDSGQIVLEHHSNLTPEKETSRSKLLAENWNAPIVFTTGVQFLEALFSSGTRGARRMHQLANAVIIFDEIQTIPLKTIHPFCNAVNLLTAQCGTTAIFCSATQPLLHAVDPVKGAARLAPESEMIPDVRNLYRELRRVQVIDKRKSGGWTNSEVASLADRALNPGRSVLIVVNTKAAARSVYEHCLKESDAQVFHLSTNMCPAHRMAVLKEIQPCLDPDNPKRTICVSTQLIEAGVDIDFGTVIRYLAGLDSIAQAAGRCNRHGRRESGELLILNPADESLAMLPEIRIGKEKTERCLDEYEKNPAAFADDPIGPLAMERYYKYYFFERAHEMAYPLSHTQVGRDETLLSLLGKNELSVKAYNRAKKKAPPFLLRQSFRTAAEAFRAIDAPTEGIIVPYGEEGRAIIAELCSVREDRPFSELLRRAQLYSVNVFPNVLRKLSERGCIHESGDCCRLMYLDERYYSRNFGVSLEQVEELGFLNA